MAVTLTGLERVLGLDPAFIRRLLARAESDGLVTSAKPLRGDRASGTAQAWTVTPSGWQALETGGYSRTVHERREFHFLEAPDATRTPHFLNLTYPDFAAAVDEGKGRTESEPRRFDLPALAECISQSRDWKERRGFPQEIVDIVGVREAGAQESGLAGETLPWQRVIVDRLVQLFVLLMREPGQWRAIAVRPDDWTLHAAQPCLTFEDRDLQEALPCVREYPALEAFRQAWLLWGQSRNLPAVEMEACSLERSELRLRVRAGKKLMDRLRSSRSEALKGEAWVLAGEGNLRAAALLDIAEA